MKALKDIGERKLLKRYRNAFPLTKDVYIGSGDDTAVLYRDAKTFDLLTTDFVIEDKHFKRSTSTGFEIGWKAMARNLSDIAAMGGWPVAAVVGLACPKTTSLTLLSGIEQGLRSASQKFGCPIVGGDLSTTNKITISVTIMGRVEKKCLTTRAGAKLDDLIVCTGTLGGSICGKHKKFTPRLKEARFLVEHIKPNAMIDMSDGLVQDLGHILDESKCGAELYEVQIPISQEVKKRSVRFSTQLKHALCDGEDYELLFTMNARKVDALFVAAKKDAIKTQFTVLGKTTSKRGIVMINEAGSSRKIMMTGYEHFR